MLLLVWGPLIALARVAMGVHYVSDIVAGAALGVLFGVVIAILLPMAAPLIAMLT
jgi:membrane-associated phospholipid phosphatase